MRMQGHEVAHRHRRAPRPIGSAVRAGEQQDMRLGGRLIGGQTDRQMLREGRGSQVHGEAPTGHEGVDRVHADVGRGPQQRGQMDAGRRPHGLQTLRGRVRRDAMRKEVIL